MLENSMRSDSDDSFQLSRFVDAQAGSYDTALAELKAGEKRSHWMWFIFPQVAGLGSSVMAQRYAIKSRDEAIAYLAHPVLGPRLRECTAALLQLPSKRAEEIMGYPDDRKLKSSMTLFASVSGPRSPFEALLEKYFNGERDKHTVGSLSANHAE
jgi:uncharacterized protein (DUF1810 family)